MNPGRQNLSSIHRTKNKNQNKKKDRSSAHSNVVTHHSTNHAHRCLTSECRWEKIKSTKKKKKGKKKIIAPPGNRTRPVRLEGGHPATRLAAQTVRPILLCNLEKKRKMLIHKKIMTNKVEGKKLSRRRDLNPQPLESKSNTLPLRHDDKKLTKGFEPSTFCLGGRRATIAPRKHSLLKKII